ncbi:MAG: DUF262 domain-containing protein [Nitrospinae bacterium]|nr:DUF262 domain-containing protein [Nitrospinota bacterium]
MLSDEITITQRQVRTDAYQMSIGEIVSMYEKSEIIVDPEFQRLFRWKISQKTKLIESILLGIPLPSIFVFEKDDGTWELIDGLQRISTILEFMGILKSPEGSLLPPSILESTKYLPSLHNAVWERSKEIVDTLLKEQMPFDKSQQLAIKRSRIGVEILKRPSDDQAKYDLFQRLNAGGTLANAQELRNCIILMINRKYFHAIKKVADSPHFRRVISVTEEQVEKQRHLEMAVRFLVHVNIDYDGKLDVEEYIDEGIIELSRLGKGKSAADLIDKTFRILDDIAGENALKRFQRGSYTGKVGLVGLEGIAVGIGKNIDAISDLAPIKAKKFIEDRIKKFWSAPECESFTSPGLRGTTRIQRTVPFGHKWFRP